MNDSPRGLCNLVLMAAALLLGSSVEASLNAAAIDVYILTGQSNSLGTTGLESPHAPGVHAADVQTALFWSNVSSSNTAYPPVLYGTSGGAVTTLQVQQGDGGVNPTFWGPEIGFARFMFDHGHSNIFVIKASRGGGGNTLWDKDSFDANASSGHMWGHLRDTVDAGLAAIVTQGDAFSIKGLIYMQGESNSAAEAGIADDRLSDLIGNLRSHINGAYPNTANAMHTAIAEIAASQSNASRQITTQLQSALAAASADVTFVPTNDLPLKSDGIHFGRDPKLTIGERLGDVFIAISEQPNGITGDVNQNGVVFGDGTGMSDADDVTAFVAGWRTITAGLTNHAKTLQGDLNLDGVTGLADAFILHNAFAAQGVAVSIAALTGAGVPEPSALALASMAGLLLVTRRSWRHGCGVAPCLALLLLVLSGRPANAADVEVYLLTGQSNSLGTTADPSESNVAPGSDASDATTRFFWSNVSSSNGTYPIGAFYGDSAGAITTLQAQQGDGGSNSLFWGPEIGFARAMADAGHANVMVIKASRGGGGNTLWSKAAFQSNPNSGHMYQQVLNTVQAATAELTTAGHTFRIAGLMYLQGESDNAAEAGAAGQRFTELLTNLRADLPNAANMHAVIGGIAAAGSSRDLVRTRQSAIALHDPTIDYFPNLDLAGLLYDGLHFNKPAKLEIGRRYAERFLQAAGELPIIESAGFAAVAGAADATRMVFDQFVPDVDGPPQGTNLVHLGAFGGFADGVNGQPRVGLILESSDSRVIFGDRHPFVPSSDLVVGTVDLVLPPRVVANAVGGATASAVGDGGRAIRFTFVDPLDPNRKATVASAAFQLGFLVPEDQVTVSFLDVDGNVLHRTGEMSDGSFGFVSRIRFGGDMLSNIHQIVLEGAPTAGWTIGHSNSLSVPDFAFQGFRVVPEPHCGLLIAFAAHVVCVIRRRRSRIIWDQSMESI